MLPKANFTTDIKPGWEICETKKSSNECVPIALENNGIYYKLYFIYFNYTGSNIFHYFLSVLDILEDKEIRSWLENRRYPWTEILVAWKRSTKYRLNDINCQSNNFLEIFKNWPAYKHTNGYDLVNIRKSYPFFLLINRTFFADWNRFWCTVPIQTQNNLGLTIGKYFVIK